MVLHTDLEVNDKCAHVPASSRSCEAEHLAFPLSLMVESNFRWYSYLWWFNSTPTVYSHLTMIFDQEATWFTRLDMCRIS